MTTTRMTTAQADEMAKLFIDANRSEFGETFLAGLSIGGSWNSLESHLTRKDANAVEMRILRILNAKWTGFLRNNGFSR